ncbi:hypothetical protein D5018_02175 [Parashewanella curva]|uniref:Outer membrane protein beta-barrel domain-containing protein n=1 Tax=Parashewanella curva TaxID=2338552 RepID=A0A3L8Q0Z3_9GAMM|nr:hypothetical protein [Parashewanella curva]RLV61306.1 hypothetical protein D5018_02175 [Parashewanella curva]
MKLSRAPLLLAFLGLSMPAMADSSNGIAIKAGTLGAGIEYYHGLTDNVNVRLGVNAFNANGEFEEASLKYDAELELRSASLIFDYHPFDSSGFRMSAGAFYNGNKANLEALAVNGEFEFNGQIYKVEDVGSAKGQIEFQKFAPYLGLGWAFAPTSTSNWGFNVELGAYYHNTPQTQLNVTCGQALSTSQCDVLLDNVVAEQKEFEDDIKEYKFYPVFNVGIQYRF